MGSPRTQKRRRQRQAHKAKIAAWRAQWAAMSSAQQQEFLENRKKRGLFMAEVNRVAQECMRDRLAEQFKDSVFMRYLRR